MTLSDAVVANLPAARSVGYARTLKDAVRTVLERLETFMERLPRSCTGPEHTAYAVQLRDLEAQVAARLDDVARPWRVFSEASADLRRRALEASRAAAPAASAGGGVAIHRGDRYVCVGGHAGKTIYARLDPSLASELGDFALYTAAMGKGVISSGSTGSDGIKHESGLGCWVVKVTIRQAAASAAVDNLVSPAADGETVGDNIYLNFDRTIRRH